MKILSEGKFRSFNGFQSMGIKPTYKLNFDSTQIECTDDHLFLRDDGVWVEAKNMVVDEKYSKYRFLNSIKTKKQIEVFDAINVENTNSFYAEGITAHNCSLLYIDETAFVENWDEFFQSVYPTISSGKKTKILYTSTPNGLNHFHKTCEFAQLAEDDVDYNGFTYIEVPWQRVPGRDEAWRKDTLAAMNGDTEQFAQEFECVGEDTEIILKDIGSDEIVKTTIGKLYRWMQMENS